MPLSNRVCEEIVSFRTELRARLPAADEAMTAWIAERLDCGRNNAAIIWKMHQAQCEISEIPTSECLLVEELFAVPQRENAGPESRRKSRAPQTPANARHYFFHSVIGRAANDSIARVVAFRLNKLRGGNAIATPHDYGFILTVTATQHFTEEELPGLLSPIDFERDVHEALSQSHMLQYHFRNAAQTGLMVYRNFFGEQKSARKLTWSAEVIFNVLQRHEPDHVLLREARRDTLATFLDTSAAANFLEAQQHRPIKLCRVDKVPPLAFAMYATKIKEALLIEDPFEVQERLFHQWWKEFEEES
jgi:ATP-dependent Lhr-like helicase